MVKQARKLIKDGKIGEIRKVVVLYPQEWLTNTIEKDGAKGVYFVHKTVESSKSKKWVNVQYDPHAKNLSNKSRFNSQTGS